MKYFFLVLWLLILIPSSARAAVRITEIAWMGIAGANGQYGEWLELYNDGADAVSVAGWKLYSGGGSQTIFTLTKSIPAKSYFLVERTTASVPDPLPGIDDESGTFGGGGLSNAGEDLVLKDAGGTTIQSLLFGSGWPAGDATTKQTMQWDDTKWVTAPATPKAPYTSGSGGTETPTPEASTGGGGQAARAPRTEPHIAFEFPKTLYKAVAYTFKATPILEYMIPHFGVFRWNMGDGTFVEQTEIAPLEHTYQYAGIYTLSFAYYRASYEHEPTLVGSATIKVLDPTLTLLSIDAGKALKIQNETDEIVDMSGWQLVGAKGTVIFPPMSMLAPQADITVLAHTFNTVSFDSAGVRLESPNGTTMATLGVVRPVASKTSSPILLQANADEAFASDVDTIAPQDSVIATAAPGQKRNHTKEILFGVAALVVIGLSILLERFMAQKE